MPACIHVHPPRGLIKGDVIDELPHVRRARRHRGVIRIGPMRVGGRRVAVTVGSRIKSLRTSRQIVLRVQDLARHPQPPATPPAPCHSHRRTAAGRGRSARSSCGSSAPPSQRGRSLPALLAGPRDLPLPRCRSTELASSPAPAAPTPFKKPRREGRICASSIVTPMSSRPARPVSGPRVRPG